MFIVTEYHQNTISAVYIKKNLADSISVMFRILPTSSGKQEQQRTEHSRNCENYKKLYTCLEKYNSEDIWSGARSLLWYSTKTEPDLGKISYISAWSLPRSTWIHSFRFWK